KIIYRKYFKKGSSILDVGCGSGRTTVGLKEMGYNIFGVDLTPAMIKTAKEIAREKQLKIHYEVQNATDLRFQDSSFDNALFSFNGWCQIPNHERRQKALNEIYRVIKPKGYFIFTIHERHVFGKRLPFWTWQAFKMYALKPLGLNIKEIEWGDRFFKAVAKGVTQYNYIHIPSRKEVKEMVKEAGFGLVYNAKRSEITDKDNNLDSGNCTFWVCRK
ncbi:class I SAM-dependent methyltransferase, partial [Candidatus Woesearchaeota archaeon]|nr:class I SAM-dependent methyltransferase [Candidatus Woesearchaeota archaeon]